MGAVKKVDAQGRTDDQKERDEWFLAAYKKAQRGTALGALDPTRFSFAHDKHFVEVVRKNAEGTNETMKIPLAPIAYDRVQVEKTLRAMAPKGASIEEIGEALFADGMKEFVAITNEGQMGGKSAFTVAPSLDGTLQLNRAYDTPLLGTRMTLDKKGAATLSPIFGEKEYRKWLPVIQGSAHNSWCIDFACEEVAFLAADTEKMFANLKAQLKNLHGVDVYTVQPRYLRYYSDGDMSSQRSSAYGVRNAGYPGGGLRPLLYDGPAWVVGIRMGSKLLPGRVFVNTEGKFICSDWCQREVDKGGGIDLHTGENTKHTLMTWCAGPGISRFGGDDKVLKELHGEVRKAKLGKHGAAQSVAARPEVQTVVKALNQLRRNPELKELPGKGMGVHGLRFVVGKSNTSWKNRVGVIGVFKSASGVPYTASISTVVGSDGKLHLGSHLISEVYGGDNRAAMWQGSETHSTPYVIPDKQMRKDIATALMTAIKRELGSSKLKMDSDEEDDE